MAKKAIYANIAGVYYQVDQSTNIPTHIARMARNHSHLEYDQRSREMIAAIWLQRMHCFLSVSLSTTNVYTAA